MNAGNVGRTGFLLVALGLPVYLLWRGKLPKYLSFATSGGTTAAGGGK